MLMWLQSVAALCTTLLLFLACPGTAVLLDVSANGTVVMPGKDANTTVSVQLSLPTSCKQLAASDKLQRIQPLQQFSESNFLRSVLIQTNHTFLESWFGSVATRLCDFALGAPTTAKSIQATLMPKLIFGSISPSQDNKAVEEVNLLALGGGSNVQAETDVFVAVLYTVAILMTFQGMYGKLWCDNFFEKERDEWAGDKAVDANYLKASWDKDVLEHMSKRDIKIKVQDEEPKKGKDGEANAGIHALGKQLLKWHHEGEWPTDGGEDWTAPLDPFDTIREHHEPAVHYVRVYCQQMHYSFGYRLMGMIQSMFKSGITKMKKAQEKAAGGK